MPQNNPVPEIAGFKDVDEAIDGMPIVDAKMLEQSARMLIKAYYGASKSHEDVEWSDIQDALTEACAAFGVDEEALLDLQTATQTAAEMGGDDLDMGP